MLCVYVCAQATQSNPVKRRNKNTNVRMKRFRTATKRKKERTKIKKEVRQIIYQAVCQSTVINSVEYFIRCFYCK